MNLASCKKCGIVIDLDKIKYIHMELPDNPKEEKMRDEEGYFDIEIEVYYNPDIVWGDDNPLDTWKCPICEEFNGKGN